MVAVGQQWLQKYLGALRRWHKLPGHCSASKRDKEASYFRHLGRFLAPNLPFELPTAAPTSHAQQVSPRDKPTRHPASASGHRPGHAGELRSPGKACPPRLAPAWSSLDARSPGRQHPCHPKARLHRTACSAGRSAARPSCTSAARHPHELKASNRVPRPCLRRLGHLGAGLTSQKSPTCDVRSRGIDGGHFRGAEAGRQPGRDADSGRALTCKPRSLAASQPRLARPPAPPNTKPDQLTSDLPGS